MRTGRRALLVSSWLAFGALGCATTGDGGDGGESLPNAVLGPFRELRDEELGGSHISPFALYDRLQQARDVSILDADADPSTPASFAYAAIVLLQDRKAKPEVPTDRIARYASDDGRTFAKVGQIVLAPTEEWEGGLLAGPCVIRRGGEIWLYYAAQGAIGLATSPDGVVFTPRGEPVLRPAGAGEGEALSNPSAVELPGGEVAMFFEVQRRDVPSSIRWLKSADGVTFDGAPEAVDLGTAIATESIGSPAVILQTSPTGRDALHLYFTRTSAEGLPGIHLASRFLHAGSSAAWSLAASPVFTPQLGASQPFMLPTVDGAGAPAALLFTTRRQSRTNADWGVSAAIAPGTAALSAPIDRDQTEAPPP